jgi:hypothetical protein
MYQDTTSEDVTAVNIQAQMRRVLALKRVRGMQKAAEDERRKEFLAELEIEG